MSLEEKMSGGHEHKEDHGEDHGEEHDDEHEEEHGHEEHHEEHPHPKKIPKSVKKFYEREDFIDGVVERTESEHTSVYEAMKEKFLRDPKTGHVSYKPLDDKKKHKEIAEFMANEYLSRIKNIDKHAVKVDPKDENDVNLILHRYFGVTKDLIHQRLSKNGAGYKQKVHERVRDKHLERIENELKGNISAAHIGEDDLEQVIKYMSAEKILDAARFKSNPAAIGDFLRIHRADKGNLSYGTIQKNEELSKYLNPEHGKYDPAKPEEHGKDHGKHGHHAPAKKH